MQNTMRDRTEEHRDRDNTDAPVVPPPKTPAANHSGHVPGGATEMAEVNRALHGETDLKKDPPKKD